MPAAPPLPHARTLRCPSCGAPHELHGGPRSQVLVCGYCDSAIDLRDPNYAIIWKYDQKIKFQPLIPLGARGTIRGELMECIGFVRRAQNVDGIDYTWNEYLLFNPMKGYRWLVEYNGHWSYVKECRALPVGAEGPIATDPPHTWARYEGAEFKHFSTYRARVTYVLGEFYWDVRVGQTSELVDYVSPPYVLSGEMTDEEIVWSVGQYMAGSEVFEAFKLPGAPMPTVGVYLNQPSPFAEARKMWGQFWLFISLVFLITLLFTMFSSGSLIFNRTYEYTQNVKDRNMVIPSSDATPPYIEIPGRTSNLEVTVNAELDNRWAWFPMILVNQDDNTATEFAVDADYYHGVSDGESWSEGSRTGSAVVPTLKAGRYFLVVNPQSGTGSEPEKYDPSKPEGGPTVFRYTISMKRDVTQWSFFWWSILFLLPIPAIYGIRAWSFENRRWMDSDHPRTQSSS